MIIGVCSYHVLLSGCVRACGRKVERSTVIIYPIVGIELRPLLQVITIGRQHLFEKKHTGAN